MSPLDLVKICQQQMERARRRGVVFSTVVDPAQAWLLDPRTGAQILLKEGFRSSIYYVSITQAGKELADRRWMINDEEARQEPEGNGSWRKRPMSRRDIGALAAALPLPNINSVYGYKTRAHSQVTHLINPWAARQSLSRDLVYVSVFALPDHPRPLLFNPQGKTGRLTECLDPIKWWQEVDAGRIVSLDTHIRQSRLPVYWDTGQVPARYILVPGKVAWTGVDGPALYLTTMQGRPLQAVTLAEANQWRGYDLRARFRQ